MICHHVARHDLCLGIALLPPGLQCQLLGPQDHRRTGNFSDAEAAQGRQVDLVVRIKCRWRLVDDHHVTKPEQWTRGDRNRHIDRIGQVGIRCQARRLAPTNADTHRAAIVAFAIKCGQQASIVTARLGNQSGRAGGRFGLIGQQGRGIAQRRFHAAALAGCEGHEIGLGVHNHRLGVDLGLVFEELDAEQFKADGRHRRRSRHGPGDAQGANTRYQTRALQWSIPPFYASTKPG